MKNTRNCPKCNSNHIVMVEGNSGPYGTGNNIQAGATIFSAIMVDRYVCCDCGFSEEWIRKEDMPKLMKSKRVYNV